MANTKKAKTDPITIKDNKTIKKRIQRHQRWQKYKKLIKAHKHCGVKTAPTRML